MLATYHDWIHRENSSLVYKRSGTEKIKFETDEVFLMEELLIRLESCLILIPEYDTEANQSLTPNFRKIATLQAIKASIFTTIKTWLKVEPDIWTKENSNENERLTVLINKKLKSLLNLLSKEELTELQKINETVNSMKSVSFDDTILCYGYFNYESDILNHSGRDIKFIIDIFLFKLSRWR